MVVGINPGYTGAGGVFVWDAVTGELILHDSRVVGSAIFTPDGRHVIVSTPQDEYDDERKHLVRIDLASGDVVADVAPDGLVATGQAVDFVGFSADGATLYLLDQPIFTEGGALHSVNAETLEILESRERVSDGSVKAHDMNGDGSRIVTGSSDGFVRVPCNVCPTTPIIPSACRPSPPTPPGWTPRPCCAPCASSCCC